ncbi:MAG TPA: alcohol dehydrogenase [Peptococcaceae bacterium]|nr:MAG: Alcohol dehydrogenase GroES domain protein [Moorella sp. 60_41]HBT47615.1 alcohol dehydrogenase [Peptococcaceae bacterium]
MKAAFVTEPYKVAIRDIQDPVVGPGEVLIRVKATGICGSDLHLYKGVHAFRKLPAILGHEVAGEVAEVGSGVTRLKPGQPVTVLPQISCGQCTACSKGYFNICPRKTVPGTPAWQGTFAEYFIAREEAVYPLPAGVDYVAGSLAEPLAVAVHAARRAELKGRERVAVLGSGTIGLLVLALARHYGVKEIIATDAYDYNLGVARKMGATATINALREDVAAKVNEITAGEGVEAVIVAASAPGIIDQASTIAARRGTIALVAMISQAIPVMTYTFVYKELELKGSQTYTAADFEAALKLLAAGAVPVGEVVTKTVGFEDTARALEILDKRLEEAVKIVVTL